MDISMSLQDKLISALTGARAGGLILRGVLGYKLEVALMGELWNKLDVFNDLREDVRTTLYYDTNELNKERS